MTQTGGFGFSEASVITRAIVTRYLSTLYFVEVGLLLLIAPWTMYWDRNIFVEMYPMVEPVVLAVSVRGAVSGLGVVNLFAAILEFACIIKPSEPTW